MVVARLSEGDVRPDTGRGSTPTFPRASVWFRPMGVLDDAIREHLDLKRKHGISEEELQRQEEEALGPARRSAPQESEGSAGDAAEVAEGEVEEGAVAPEPDAAEVAEAEAPELDEPAAHEPPAAEEAPPERADEGAGLFDAESESGPPADAAEVAEVSEPPDLSRARARA